MMKLLPFAVVASLTITLPGWAGEALDHDRARAAVEQGRSVPLRQLLERVAQDYPGKLLQVELEEKGERLAYEVKLLTDSGALLELHYDAATLELLRVDGHDDKAGRHHGERSRGEEGR